MRNRLAILTFAAVVPLTGAASLAVAGQAAADPNKSTVTLAGSVDDCPNGTTATKVSIKAGNKTGRTRSRT